MLTLSAFMKRIVDGDCSYTWNVPVDVQRKCLPELLAWASSTFELERERPLPRDITWKIYEKLA